MDSMCWLAVRSTWGNEQYLSICSVEYVMQQTVCWFAMKNMWCNQQALLSCDEQYVMQWTVFVNLQWEILYVMQWTVSLKTAMKNMWWQYILKSVVRNNVYDAMDSISYVSLQWRICVNFAHSAWGRNKDDKQDNNSYDWLMVFNTLYTQDHNRSFHSMRETSKHAVFTETNYKRTNNRVQRTRTVLWVTPVKT